MTNSPFSDTISIRKGKVIRMFRKKPPERNPIIDQYDRKWWALNEVADNLRGWAQAVKWYGLPLEVLIKDSAPYKATLEEVHEAQLNLRNVMGVYDTDRHEFMQWVKRHFDELPENYQNYLDPKTSMEEIRYALADIQKNGYFYFKHGIKKN